LSSHGQVIPDTAFALYAEKLGFICVSDPENILREIVHGNERVFNYKETYLMENSTEVPFYYLNLQTLYGIFAANKINFAFWLFRGILIPLIVPVINVSRNYMIIFVERHSGCDYQNNKLSKH